MIEIQNINKSFINKNKQVKVFDRFSLKIQKGEFVALIGPNGSGKTTLLNIIAGFTEVDGGKVYYDHKSTSLVNIGYVFQDYKNSLFPWLTVEENITLPLRGSNISKRSKSLRVKRLKAKLGVDVKLSSFPYQLSGGQQQIVSILRSLIQNPDIFLLDEPFSSLDYPNTLQILSLLHKIWADTKITTLFVSHEIDGALFLAQKIIVLSKNPHNKLKVFQNTLPYPKTVESITGTYANRLKKKFGVIVKFWHQLSVVIPTAA